MRKIIVTLAALLATAGLIYTVFHFPAAGKETPSAQIRLVRVWVSEREPAVWSWLRKQARQYEKATGTRVYLRAAASEKPEASGEEIRPDLLISGEGREAVALRGYALFYRDDAAPGTTPVPTSLLFYRPSPPPGPSPTPRNAPEIERFSAILAPADLAAAVPGAVQSAHPLKDFTDGKGDAAILTAEQAEQLSFPTGVRPLPDGKGGIPICATAETAMGEAFLKALLSKDAQEGLAEAGLYSPFFHLYNGNDPVREVIESSLSSDASLPLRPEK